MSKHQIQPEYGDEQADAGRDCWSTSCFGTIYSIILQKLLHGVFSLALYCTVLHCTVLCCRYLSHGQEWSEKLRLENRTRTVKRSLDPVWDEEFSLPIRR